jgi:hypothetical protein
VNPLALLTRIYTCRYAYFLLSFIFKFLLKNLVEPRCPSHSVHTPLLTFLNLPPVKSRIVVVVYVVAGRMITNLVEIKYNMWSPTSSHRSTTLASAPMRSSKVGASYISNQMAISSTMDQTMLGVAAIYRHNFRSWIVPEVEECPNMALIVCNCPKP